MKMTWQCFAGVEVRGKVGEKYMAVFCWWKAKSPDAILESLGDMSDSFENDIREMPNIMDMSDR